MADSSVDVTAGSGTSIDTRTESSNGHHRQVVVLGDPATNAGVAPVDATNGLAVEVKTSIPAGTNAIGKLSANDGVDIGDVTINNAAGASAVNIQDGGNSITIDGTVTANAGTGTLTVTDDGSFTLAANDGIDIGDVDVTSVVPGTGATNLGKAADSIAGATDTGIAPLAIRDNALTAITPIEGDYAHLRVGNEGALWTQDFNSDALLADTNTIAGAVTGTEMQVDVVAALPTGSNAIGKLAANDAVDIGDVTINNASGASAVNIQDGGNSITIDGTVTASNTAGDIAHDGVDSGNPVKFGGRAQSPTAAPDEVADNDRVDGLFDRNGRLAVWAGSDFKSTDINDSSSGDNTIITAVAGKRIAVWAVMVVSDGTVDVRFEDGAGGTAFTGQIPLQAREGFTLSAGGLVPLWVGSSNTLLNLELSAAINVHGIVSYTELDD